MSSKVPGKHLITDAETMWVLSSPTRLEVLWAVCALGTCSAGDIAEMTGRSRTSLYPHIDQFVRAGLLIEAGTRTSGKRHEQLFRPIARLVNTRHDPDDPEIVDYHIAFGKAVARMLARIFERGINEPGAQTRGPLRDTYCTSQTVWADDETLRQINHHLNSIVEICSESQPGEGKRLIKLGTLMAPDYKKKQ